jgi:hypothetical protein
MISSLLLIELAGFSYCIAHAADHLGKMTMPDQLKGSDSLFGARTGLRGRGAGEHRANMKEPISHRGGKRK